MSALITLSVIIFPPCSKCRICFVFPKDIPQGVTYLLKCGIGPYRIQDVGHKVFRSLSCSPELCPGTLNLLVASLPPDTIQSEYLSPLTFLIHLQDRDGYGLIEFVFVYSNYDPVPGFDLPLIARGSLGNFPFSSIWLVSASTMKPPPRGSTLLATPLSWAMICCVLRAMRTAFSEGSARASSMGSETSLHLPCPDAPGGAELGDLLKKVVVRIEEEAKSGSEIIHLQAPIYRRLHIGKPISQGECQLLDRGGPGLSYVIAAYADGVPARKVSGLDGIYHQAHGGLGGGR